MIKMKNNKIIKITVAIMVVLTLVLVGYFLTSNREVEDNSILFDSGDILEIDEARITIAMTPTEGEVIPEGKVKIAKILTNEETKFVRMLVDTWRSKDFTEEDEEPSSFDNLEVGSLVAVYIAGVEGPFANATVTKVILLDYPGASDEE